MAKSDFDWHAAPLTNDTVVTAHHRTAQNMRRFMRAAIPGFTVSRDVMTRVRANTGIALAQVVAEAKRRASQK